MLVATSSSCAHNCIQNLLVKESRVTAEGAQRISSGATDVPCTNKLNVKSFPFLSLPAETRLQIYALVCLHTSGCNENLTCCSISSRQARMEFGRSDMEPIIITESSSRQPWKQSAVKQQVATYHNLSLTCRLIKHEASSIFLTTRDPV